jgi:hypothetical protein
MRDLTYRDGQWVCQRLPGNLRVILEFDFPGVVVAGGFVRDVISRDTPTDIDLFIPRDFDTERLSKKIVERFRLNQEDVHTTPNAWTFRTRPLVIQMIHRWRFDDIDSCLASFDFTISQAGIVYVKNHGWKSRCSDAFYEDLASRRLIYTSPAREEEPGGSFLRLLKFYSRGYRAPLESSADLLGRLMYKTLEAFPFIGKCEEGHPAVLDSTVASESSMSHHIRGLLVNVDPQNIFRFTGEEE